MGSQSEFFCWEIMQCETPDNCAAKKNPEKPCWQIAIESEDFRMANNICRDCIVYVLKAGNSALSQHEIETILKQKAGGKQARTYPDFTT